MSNKADGETTSNVLRILGATINIVQVFAMGIAIIMLIAMAIKWFSTSPQAKADLKKSFNMYFLGAVIIFAAVGLLQIVRLFAIGISSEVP